MNNVHIYQISEGYFRYETTTNVLLASPEKIEFPSTTLCVELPATLKWNQMSPELLKRLLIRDDSNTSEAQDMVNNSSLIPSALHNLTNEGYRNVMHYLYNSLANEVTIPELLNMTHPFEKIFYAFSLNGLFVNPNGSIKSYDMFMSDMSNFQFSIDKIFLHEGHKCFSLSLLTDQNSIINFNDIQYLKPEDSHILFWQSQFEQRTRFFLHKKGYLVSLKDTHEIVDRGERGALSYQAYESIRLEYPYKTNCRDYIKVGLSSQKECIEKCFKMKSVPKFGRVWSESHAFSADNLQVGTLGYSDEYYDIYQECKLDCKEIECHSLKHSTQVITVRRAEKLLRRNCSKSAVSTCEGEVDYEKQSSVFIHISTLPFTRTKSQPAIPLVPFLTGVFSTFGFWLGLSVFDSLNMAKKIWQKVEIARDKIRPRIRLVQGPAVYRRKLNFVRYLQRINQDADS